MLTISEGALLCCSVVDISYASFFLVINGVAGGETQTLERSLDTRYVTGEAAYCARREGCGNVVPADK